MSQNQVFISYSHKDEIWKDRLVPHLGVLEKAGQIDVWEDRQINSGSQWFEEIKHVVDRAAVTVCLISADYLYSDFCTKEEIPYLLERRERDGMLLIPVLLRQCAWQAVHWVKASQLLPRDGKSVAGDFKDDWDDIFAEVAVFIFETLSDPEYQPPAMPPHWSPLSPGHIDITRLPETGSALFGRTKELKLLNDAWESDATHVVSLVAYGGVGKSTLVNKWLEGLERDNYRGAERVFAWSFYSQGTRDRVTSADLFIREALAFFGDPTPDDGSPWDKGERLAKLVGQNRALLVLDGMEPLQSGQKVEYGKVKDPALATLLRKLAKANAGLCVISTRVPVTDLAEMDTVQAVDLERISPEAGRALLRIGGVIAADEELEALARNFGPHALALNLLGSYLHHHPGQGLEAVATIPNLEEYREQDERHAWNVLAAFEAFFGDGPEVELLRVLGLFDRPAKKGEVQAVRLGVPGHTAPVPGLTDYLAGLSEEAWHALLTRLRDLRLLTKRSTHAPDVLDAHPLVREYFGAQLQERFPEAWRKGHNRLYEHLKETTKEFPDTLDEMTPLFQAVAHGSQAERHQEALDDVYFRRILRENEHFSWKKLGSFGADLAAVSTFFDRSWDQPTAKILDADQAFVLAQAGLYLRALGRLKEAAQPMRMALDAIIAQEHWTNAARAAGNLSELSLKLGELDEALAYAEQNVDLADRSGDWEQQMTAKARLADALNQAGRLDKSEDAFRESEAIQKKQQPQYPLLYSWHGFWYCDLLLDQVESLAWPTPPQNDVEQLRQVCRAVTDRAALALEIARGHTWLVDIALNLLTLGRAHMLAIQLEDAFNFVGAAIYLDQAVDGLRQGGQQIFIPSALFARAALRRVQKQYREAWADMEEAMEIAERGSMRLFQADGLLESARLHWEEGEAEKAQDCLEKAKAMIDEMGYHRRDREVEVLERVLSESAGE